MKIFSFCILALCFWLTACVSRSGHLEEIDSYMESDPGRALEELEKVSRGELSQADFPYYALLYTQAQIKNGIVVTSDSLMRHAYEAYRNSGDDDLRKRAHFYNAQIAYYAGDLRPAMSDVIVAYDIAKAQGDPYWIAKTAEMMSGIFYYCCDFQQAEIYEVECVENYRKAGHSSSHRYTLPDLPATYRGFDRYAVGAEIFDSLVHVFYSKPMSEEDESWPPLDSCPDDKHRVGVLYAAYRQALASGKYRHAAALADSVILYQEKISAEALKESVMDVQRDFYLSKSRREAEKSKAMLYGLIAVAIVAIAIIILLVLIYRLKMRARKAELEANISALMAMKAQIESYDFEKERLNARLSEKSLTIENLFKEKWGTLNMLCNEYFELGDSENTREALLARIENELNKLKSKRNLKDIEASVDSNMGGLMSMLREECPFISEDDCVFLSLVFAGLSARAVCLFTDIKYKQFYLKKHRLAKRIAASDAAHRDLFIDKLK